jgi:Phage integrase, N-terminal SAM-like domain
MMKAEIDRTTAGRRRVERGIYLQPNGKYAICFMLDGRPHFRTLGYDLDVARAERQTFVEAARWGVLAATPRLRFGQVAAWWIERYARLVASGARRQRTLDIHRYHLERHLLPRYAGFLIRQITVQDVADLLDRMREEGRSEHTIAGAMKTLRGVIRFAIRRGWIADSPVDKLEGDERPRPAPHTRACSAASRSRACSTPACRPTAP